MKLKKYLVSFITIFTLIFAEVVSAASTAPNSFAVNGSDNHKITASNYLPGSTITTHYLKNANGNIIYCTEIRDKAVTTGSMTHTLSKELSVKYSYVLENGYPNKSITGNNEEDYFITALAVYYLVDPSDSIFTYFDLSAGTYRGSSSVVVKEMAKLVNGANSYTYTNPSIKLSTSNNLTLSSDKKYYVSSSMSVTTTGNVGNYTVKLENAPSGTIVTDTDGNAKTTFSNNEKFLVKVPVSSIKNLSTEFKVNVSATGTINKAYLYTPSDSSYQSVAVLYPDNSTVSSSTTLKLNLTTEVQISKVDVTTGKELEGATLTVKDSNGNVKDTWVSTTEVHVIKGLPAGTYTLTEEIAPDGYILSTETVKFEVKLDGTVTKVVMENKPTEVQISKIDVTTGKELEGATLTVKDSNGNVKDTWVSTTEVHVIKGLPVGVYTLTEEVAPDGYVRSTETVKFEVKNDGTVTKVVMENKPKENKNIYISKQDITTGEELEGAHLELRDESGNLIEAWVSGSEPHMIEELEPGKYYLTEILAPVGYELSTETVEFIVKEDRTVDGDVIMYNKPETVVEVPNTSSFKTITSSLIGIIIIGLGCMIIYKNYKKNEEY